MIPSYLLERYQMVRACYEKVFPGKQPPDFPMDGDPNVAVNVIDQMLAPIQNRPPTVITTGNPVIFEDITPDLPAHPARKDYRRKIDASERS